MYVLDGLDASSDGTPPEDRSAESDLRALDIASLRRALRDPDPNVRRHAVRLAADRLTKIDIVESVKQLAHR